MNNKNGNKEVNIFEISILEKVVKELADFKKEIYEKFEEGWNLSVQAALEPALKIDKELIILRTFLMNLQIRILSLENKAFDMKAKEHLKYQMYPYPQHLMCPKCGQFKFKGSETTDEHDTYLMLKCRECGYQYSPSHD